MLNIRKRINSFRYAINGIVYFFTHEWHAKVHFFSAVSVLLLAYFFQVSTIEYCILMLTITSVIVTEAINTALERLTDLVSPEYHTLAKIVKDVGAGAVLISAIGALCIGGIIFIPRIINLF